MHIVIAPDSFKESLDAPAVAAAIAAGLRDADPTVTTTLVPMADGGEGTLDILLAQGDGERRELTVTGPLGEPVAASFGWLSGDRTAVIEAAAANGLQLVPPDRRDPAVTTTRGVGELLLAALALDPLRVLVTVGGSATVDGGMGLARALGYDPTDRLHQPLADGGVDLARLHRLAIPAHRPWERVRLEVACDVTNPLLGERGAARVFGPQKGATPSQVEQLERGLARLAQVLRSHHGVDISRLPGGGAAGGLAAGLAGFCGAKLRPGVELIADHVRLADALARADLVITGEGKTDSQSPHGKVPAGVARLARSARIPCLILSGAVTTDAQALADMHVRAARAASPPDMPLAEAMRRTPELLQAAAARLLRDFNADSLPPLDPASPASD